MSELRNALPGDSGGRSESVCAARATESLLGRVVSGTTWALPAMGSTPRSTNTAHAFISAEVRSFTKPRNMQVRCGGSVWESNPPNPTMSGHNRFEDDESHQAPDTPLSGSREDDGTLLARQDRTDHHRLRNARKIVRHNRRGQRNHEAPGCLRIYYEGFVKGFRVAPVRVFADERVVPLGTARRGTGPPRMERSGEHRQCRRIDTNGDVAAPSDVQCM